VSETADKLNAANTTRLEQARQSVQDLTPEEILQRARQRGEASGEPFAGDITPVEAWVLFSAGAALLVDVRTAEELKFVGRVPEAPHVAWKSGPNMSQNINFVQQIEVIAPKETVLLLLCRSGVRSASAAEALTDAGYDNTFNILEGFEGELDSQQRRGTHNGWRYWGLPWILE